ncbi:LacI family DNA-binding transcriptional regulator [Parablautia muri]|uniref:LacI family transcriptional regulator n=1 Tax=Parablautia muri TaxID=2320879 RepID=A0A9X5BFZ3_9FIRM|nr:LacI family DNA-binding transcriptional regulator [Parablautia muri]NBJ92953.1 LacI family transcriptional regulator [Parablautia muri]
MEKERVRIVDMAEELGLSTATVSNVIHGKTKKVSDETVKRVQELIEKRGYIPSMAGILLAQNNSGIIGVAVKDHEKYEGHVLEDGFVSASINALSKELNWADYFMMVKVTTAWDEIVRFASMWNMEGLVLLGFCEQDYKKLRESMHIPFVVYDGYFQETGGICNLTIDHYDGGYQVGRYLKNMGHKRVPCLSDNFICMDFERIKGCVAAMGEDAVDFLQIPVQEKERIGFYQEKEREILEYTAVFAVSDLYAVELIHYFQEKGISVPGEISIVGFDDSALCNYCSPSLTTVRQNPRVRAEKAVSILQNLKMGIEEDRTVKLPVFLVERKSVKNLNEETQ